MQNKPKIGLLDTSFSSFPLFDTFNLNEVDLYLVGGKPNDYLCQLKGSRYVNGNYASIEEIKNLKSKLKLDFIVPGCNDISYTTYCALQSQNPRKLKIFNRLNNKNEFRLFCEEKKIPSPKLYRSKDEIKSEHIIIKPELGYSGRGISVCKAHEGEQFSKYIKQAEGISQNGRAIIEEFVVGPLFSLSIFVEENVANSCFLIREFCTVNKFAVNWSFVDLEKHSDFFNKNISKINNIIGRMEIGSGLLHLQCIVDEKLDFKIIEATQRCPGDLFPWLIESQTGFDYSYQYLKEFVPENFLKERSLIPNKSMIVRHTSSHYNNETFINFDHQFDKVLMSVPTMRCGEQFSDKNKYRSGVHFYVTSKVDLKKKFDKIGVPL